MLTVGPLLSPSSESLTESQAIERAKGFLGQERKIGKENMRVERAVASTWSDGSLGCPHKGTKSVKALTSGYRVILRAGGETHDIRVAGDQAVLCEKDETGSKIPPRDELQAAARLHDQVLQDLAERLKVPVSEVKVNHFKPTTWPDRSAGCPESGKSYPETPTRGFVIEVEHLGRTYVYRADLETARYCVP
jgi:hypothetical protein